jgi:hypothetical protein
MNKFKLHDFVARGKIPLSVAIAMVLNPHHEGAGYSALPNPDQHHGPEHRFGGGVPLQPQPGIFGTLTPRNGTGTHVQGTSTHYFWPVP